MKQVSLGTITVDVAAKDKGTKLLQVSLGTITVDVAAHVPILNNDLVPPTSMWILLQAPHTPRAQSV